MTTNTLVNIDSDTAASYYLNQCWLKIKIRGISQKLGRYVFKNYHLNGQFQIFIYLPADNMLSFNLFY